MNFGASLKHNKMKPTFFLITQLLISVSLKNSTNSRLLLQLSFVTDWYLLTSFTNKPSVNCFVCIFKISTTQFLSF